MKIGIDTRDLDIARTGEKTVLEELCRFLPQAAPHHSYVFLKPRRKTMHPRSRFGKLANHIRFIWWKMVVLPVKARFSGIDVLLCCDYFAPIVKFGVATVTLFHGANFWERPKDYGSLWGLVFCRLAVIGAKRADKILTVSEFSKERISKLTNINMQRIIRVYNAPKSSLDVVLNRSEVGSVLSKYGLSLGTRYLLHVGVFEKRKNLLRLIEAFKFSLDRIHSDCKLVLVGQKAINKRMDESRSIVMKIKEYSLEERVILTGHVSDRELKAIYQCADIFVFPSLYEGFGIPILEAFRCNVPVMCSRSTALPEVGGEAVLYFDPYNIEEIASAIVCLMVNEGLRERMIANGSAQLRKFSWTKSAEQVAKVFNEIFEERENRHKEGH